MKPHAHAHEHDHAGAHSHEHSYPQAHGAPQGPAQPRTHRITPSLLMTSSIKRVLWALGLIALLWLAVGWAVLLTD